MPSHRRPTPDPVTTARHRRAGRALALTVAAGVGWAALWGGGGVAAAAQTPSTEPSAPAAVGPASTSPTVAGATTTAPGSTTGLAPLVLTQPLPTFTAAPAGPTDGILTATEFASQSSDPTRAEQQFDALSAQPGFASFIRLWTDQGAPGAGANDVAVLLFRINDRTAARMFFSGLNLPFAGTAGSTPFAVPSVPGARGYSVVVSSPVAAVERVVVFRAGRYVSMVELASTTASANPAPLTATQAVSVSFLQLEQIRTGDPSGAVDPVTPPPRPATTAAPAATTDSGDPVPIAVIAVLALVAVGLVGLLIWSRRRSKPALAAGPAEGSPVADPWGPTGVFAVLGDLSGTDEPTDALGSTGVISDTGGPVLTPSPVPAMASTTEPAPVGPEPWTSPDTAVSSGWPQAVPALAPSDALTSSD